MARVCWRTAWRCATCWPLLASLHQTCAIQHSAACAAHHGSMCFCTAWQSSAASSWLTCITQLLTASFAACCLTGRCCRTTSQLEWDLSLSGCQRGHPDLHQNLVIVSPTRHLLCDTQPGSEGPRRAAWSRSKPDGGGSHFRPGLLAAHLQADSLPEAGASCLLCSLAKGSLACVFPKNTPGAALADALHAVQGQIPRQQGRQGTFKTLAASDTAPIKGACSCQGRML